MWWCVRTTLDYVIFMSKLPSCQVAIYCIVRGQLFLSLLTSPKNTFFSKGLFSETARLDLSIEPIKFQYLCKNALELIRLWRPVPILRSDIVGISGSKILFSPPLRIWFTQTSNTPGWSVKCSFRLLFIHNDENHSWCTEREFLKLFYDHCCF